MSERMRVERVMSEFETGDQIGWGAEFDWLRTHHSANIRSLTRSVLNVGFERPILLGNDGRVWDGHHRMYVAFHLGIETIPVEHVRADDREREPLV